MIEGLTAGQQVMLALASALVTAVFFVSTWPSRQGREATDREKTVGVALAAVAGLVLGITLGMLG